MLHPQFALSPQILSFLETAAQVRALAERCLPPPMPAFLDSSAFQCLRAAQASPTVQLLQQMADSPVFKALENARQPLIPLIERPSVVPLAEDPEPESKPERRPIGFRIDRDE